MSKIYEPYEIIPDNLMTMDADFMGHALVVLADYHSYIDYQWELGNMDDSDWAYESYLLGNMEGRLFANAWDEDDYEQLAVWEQDMGIYQQEHGGVLFPGCKNTH